MEKQGRKQIIELLFTVEEGIRYIKASAQTTMFGECTLALRSITEACQKGLSAERYSDYAKLFDQIMAAMKQGCSERIEHTQLKKTCDLCCKLLQMTVKELLHEKEVKKEILFLPYKASMWDSLESIWLAAKADPNCNVYVMPIPYCDRSPGGEASTWYCEADQMPDYVPITDWQTYDIAVRKPDVIYIHNPYDECNLVTSVHPRFYSGELKKHTAMLVYVPYFVVGETLPQSFYALPAYVHVNKIIVQSEKMMDYYEPKLTKGKLAALGSPKVDRVLRYKNDKLPIPKEWTARIGNRKVLFYNTSLSSLLQNREKALAKMRYVFSLFKGREDVVLLWRPHPLIKATLKSMLAPLTQEYGRLEEGFVQQDTGILDTTADVTAAIAISDAYIGEDTSSIVHLFGAAGKPIFVLDMEMAQEVSEDGKNAVCFSDCFVDGETIWFVPQQMNALCKMDINSGKVEVEVGLPGNEGGLSIPYVDVLKVEEKMYLLPHAADSILEYDLKTKFLKRTEIPGAGVYNFDRMIRYQDYLFLKPKCYPAIVRYDLRDGTLKFYRECMKGFLQSNGEPMFTWAVCQKDNVLLMASAQQNKVLAFNMDTGKHKIHTVGKLGNSYFSMAFDGKDYWLVQCKNSAIVRWNYKTGKVQEYSAFPSGFSVKQVGGGTLPFVSIISCENFLLAFPCLGNMIVKIDIDTGEMSKYDVGLPYIEGEHKSDFYHNMAYYFAKRIDDEQIVTLSNYDNSVLIFNCKNHTWKKQLCRLDRQYIKEHLTEKTGFKHWSGNLPYVCRENIHANTLENFINGTLFGAADWQEQLQFYSKIINNLDGTCGEKVHQYIMEEIQ